MTPEVVDDMVRSRGGAHLQEERVSIEDEGDVSQPANPVRDVCDEEAGDQHHGQCDDCRERLQGRRQGCSICTYKWPPSDSLKMNGDKVAQQVAS